MSQNVVFQAGVLPPNYCWPGSQQFYNDIVALLTGTVAGSPVNVSVSPNPPADLTALWVKTVGGFMEGIYLYLGQWIRPHPCPPSGNERRLWRGLADGSIPNGIWSYDGGDGQDPAVVTPHDAIGAMWTIDTDFEFKMPIGVGTNSVAYNGLHTAINRNDTGGEEKHELVISEIPPHTHHLGSNGVATLPADGHVAQAGTGASVGQPGLTDTDSAGGDGSTPPVTIPHNNMPPYIGVYFIKRTARLYITG